MAIHWQDLLIKLKQSYVEKKILLIEFDDGSTGEYSVNYFDDTTQIPVWSTSPEIKDKQCLLAAKSIEFKN